MEMEYNWNDFHFHAACTFTGQLSTAEERSSPTACSITHYPLSYTCKNTFMCQCKQMDHLGSCFIGSQLAQPGYQIAKIFTHWMSPDVSANLSSESSYKGWLYKGVYKGQVQLLCQLYNLRWEQTLYRLLLLLSPLASRTTITPAIKIQLEIIQYTSARW